MITATAQLSAAWLPLSSLVVEQHERRSVKRMLFYVGMMEEYPDRHAGPPLTVRPLRNGTYAIQDGHHRYLAYVLTGKRLAPCVIIEEG